MWEGKVCLGLLSWRWLEPRRRLPGIISKMHVNNLFFFIAGGRVIFIYVHGHCRRKLKHYKKKLTRVYQL